MSNMKDNKEPQIVDKTLKTLTIKKILTNNDRYLVDTIYKVLIHYLMIGDCKFDSKKEKAIDIELTNSNNIVENDKKGLYEIIYNSLYEALKYEDISVAVSASYIKENANKYKDSNNNDKIIK